MSRQIRQFFKLTIFLLSLAVTVNAQEHADDLLWYQRYFEPYDPQSVDQDIDSINTSLAKAAENLEYVKLIKLNKEAGLIHLTRTHDYDSALQFLIRALTLEDSLDIHNKQVFTHLAIAEVFDAVGNPEKSAQELEKASRLNDRDRDIPILVLIMNKLGKVNAARGEIEMALENFQLALEYRDAIPKSLLAETLFNQAHLFSLEEKNIEALEVHKEALGIWRSIHDRKHEAQSLNDIGKLYHLMRNDDREFANHVAALEIRQSLKDTRGMAESYNNIGALYYRQKNYQRAIANLELGLSAAKESQDLTQMKKSYEFLADCYKALGNYKAALQNQEDFNAMTDLIQQEINDQRLLEMQSRYQIGQREIQIQNLEDIQKEKERELERQRTFQNYLFLIIGLIAVIVILVSYFYFQKRKSNALLKEVNEKIELQNTQLQELNATKDKFFSIISHDIKGPLNSLTSFSSMLTNHFDALSKEEIQMLATDSDKSLKNLFAMLENLLEWARSQTGNIEFKPEIFDLNTLLAENKALLEGQAQNKRITILHDGTKQIKTQAHKNSINTVIRNLLSNSIKFTPEGGAISLEAKGENQQVVVSISDTGVGMRKEIVDRLFRIDAKHSTKGTANEKGTGLGLILCKEFVEKNGGRIWVTSEEGKGSVFYFSLPVSK